MANRIHKYIILEDAYFTSVDIRNSVSCIRPECEFVAGVEATGEAIEILKREKVDFIIADTEVCDGDSIESLKRAGIKTPVIFISGYKEQRQQVQGLEVLDFLLKPVSPESLGNAIAKLDRNLANQ